MFLSYGGRVRLVQSMIEGVESFWSQIFLLLKKLIKMVESNCRAFIWSGTNLESKRAPIAWEKVYFPRLQGELGLRNILVWNKYALLKHLWDIARKKDRLWVLWVHEYLIKHHHLDSMRIPQGASYMLRKILK